MPFVLEPFAFQFVRGPKGQSAALVERVESTPTHEVLSPRPFKYSSIFRLIVVKDNRYIDRIQSFQNTPAGRLHGSMNPFGQKRPRHEYENDLAGPSEHPQHFAGNTNGFTTHPTTFEHQSIPFSSAGEVVAAGAGIFVPQFVVSSAEGSLGLATHRSSLPIVYTQGPPQSAMLLNGIHPLPHGLRAVHGLHEQIQTKQQSSDGEIQDLGYLQGQAEPRMSPLPGFPSLMSYEDTENRYVR